MLVTGAIPTAVNSLTLSDISLLFTLLMLYDFYRQRFFLDWRNEWGWHWRAGFLQSAKWPYLLLALYQVLLNRRLPYTLTSKVTAGAHREGVRSSTLFWPHLLVAGFVSRGLSG